MKTTTSAAINKSSVTDTTTVKPFWVLLGLFIFIFSVLGYQLMAAGSYNFFVWGDHLLGADLGNPPVVMWLLAGAFLGAGAGALVIWRKYQVSLKWCLATVLPVMLLFFILELVASPLTTVEPRSLPIAKDTTTTTTSPTQAYSAPIIRSHHRPKHVPPAPPVKPVEPPEDACAVQLADININARTDSVQVYYRIAMQRDGAWSAWRSKFIPQQGQFRLTEDGPVKANRIQYYYEIKSVLSRSAQNPYTRMLCDGQLVIDTY
ncbi:hypothetical protein C8P68_11223 [Mucilaginibacter yixingensis]|uniref:Uncharacterized protein n=1 Tax=Mucilaginibacter yixingensis TaxID=1295612 RepID=A0A2T5J4J1_9SPHI|nr:hypothetical protein [Mucilaginibacter yixingensis]PTQ92423.1 hypothetical protein C8P68_11223 [Mucilaginibacter yixingensis]